MINIDQPPVELHGPRQLFMAKIARHYYFQMAPDVAPWRRNVAAVNFESTHVIEPRILQYVSALGYRALGGERLWFPRLLSVIFYMIGGIFLWLTACRLASPGAALFTVAYYLFDPFGVVFSRSLQPDIPMLMLALIALWGLVRHGEHPAAGNWVLATVFGALAVLMKPQIVFMLGAVVGAAAIWKRGSWRGLFAPGYVAMMTVMLLPGVAHYGWHMTRPGYMSEMPSWFIAPSLWLSPNFWSRWLWHVQAVAGAAAVAGCLIGLVMGRPGLSRAVLVGGLLGFLAFGLVMTYGVRVHNYYSFPVVVIVALSIGPVCAGLAGLALGAAPGALRRAGVWAAALALIPLSLPDAYRDLVHHVPDYLRQVETCRRAGEAVDHSTRCIMMGSFSGEGLRYYGEVAGPMWPGSGRFEHERIWGMAPIGPAERLQRFRDQSPLDFFIITDFELLRGHPELKEYLARTFPVLRQADDYLIYDLRGRP
jgi:hypothetical protein